MKHILRTYMLFASLLLTIHSMAQEVTDPVTAVKAINLEITNHQTVVLLFPAAIKSVDRGSQDILTKTVKEVTNVVKVKAAHDSLQPTNLHVFTADGKVYPFTVTYIDKPLHYTIRFTSATSSPSTDSLVQFEPHRLNDDAIEKYAEMIAGLRPIRRGPGSKWQGRVHLRVTGAYLQKGVLFFQFRVRNQSPVPYPIDFIRPYIRDNHQAHRSSITEKEITPLFSYSLTRREIDAYSQANLVLAFDQFTIAANKHLAVELFEKNGDRHLSCRLKGRDILKARSLEANAAAYQDRRTE